MPACFWCSQMASPATQHWTRHNSYRNALWQIVTNVDCDCRDMVLVTPGQPESGMTVHNHLLHCCKHGTEQDIWICADGLWGISCDSIDSFHCWKYQWVMPSTHLYVEVLPLLGSIVLWCCHTFASDKHSVFNTKLWCGPPESGAWEFVADDIEGHNPCYRSTKIYPSQSFKMQTVDLIMVRSSR